MQCWKLRMALRLTGVGGWAAGVRLLLVGWVQPEGPRGGQERSGGAPASSRGQHLSSLSWDWGHQLLCECWDPLPPTPLPACPT